MADGGDAYDVMDLKALRCLWAVARLGSLTKAGIELGVSESAISQRLKSLESHVGSKLYETPGGRFRLTDAGTRTMEMAVSLFDRIEQFQEELGNRTGGGSLTLATQDAIIRYLLPDIVRRFAADEPDVQLRLLSRSGGDALEMVRHGEADVAIVSRVPISDSLSFQAVKSYEAYLLFPPGHPLLRKGRPSFSSLLNQDTVMRFPLIVPERTDPAHSRVSQALARLGLPLNIAFEVGTIEAVKHYVSLGLGLGVVSGICLSPADVGKIEAIEIPKDYGGTTDYGVVLRRDKFIGSALGRFLAALGLR